VIDLLLWLLILVCVVGYAVYAGVETGVISIHKMRLRHFVREGVKGARLLERFMDQPDRLLGTTLVGTNLCLVILSVVAAGLADRSMGHWGQPVSVFGVPVLVLIFCEYLPKAWFQSRPFHRSRRFARLLRVSEMVFRPLSVSVVWLTRYLVPGASKAFSHPRPFVTKEELKILAHEGEKSGELTPRERVMIHRVFELSAKPARQIMVPRQEMTFVESDMTITEFFKVARSSALTRMPVYDRAQDAFVGIVNVFYVLSAGRQDEQKTVADFVRKPLFIPENMPVDDILPRMRRSQQPVCLVQDGDKRVTGLITTEDILEEIVGEL